MLPLSNNYYVYLHFRLDKNEYFYVGIGLLKNRAYSKHHRNKHWRNIVNKTDYRVEILFSDLSKKEAVEKEIELIKFYGRKNLKTGTLVNLTDGGEGNFNAIFSKERKEKISKSNKNKKRSEEVKKNLSEIKKGKKLTTDHKDKISKGNLGKKRSEEAKIKYSKAKKGSKLTISHIESIRKRQSKPILQYDLNNNLLRRWDSSLELSKSLHISRNYIKDYCLNIKTHKNYTFKYA